MGISYIIVAIVIFVFIAIFILIPGIIALCVAGSVRKRRKSIERTLHLRK